MKIPSFALALYWQNATWLNQWWSLLLRCQLMQDLVSFWCHCCPLVLFMPWGWPKAILGAFKDVLKYVKVPISGDWTLFLFFRWTGGIPWKLTTDSTASSFEVYPCSTGAESQGGQWSGPRSMEWWKWKGKIDEKRWNMQDVNWIDIGYDTIYYIEP